MSATGPDRTTVGPGRLRREERVAVLALGAVAVLRLVQVLRHEPWRDELQAWAIATDTASLGALLDALRHEGHPPLWYLLLRGVSLVWDDPDALRALAWVLAVGTATLVLLRAPWPLWLRLAVTAGYYLGYEYAVVSRSYSLQAFLVLLACVVLTARRPRPWAVAASLAGLALCSVFGLAIALSLAACVPLLAHRSPGTLRRWAAAGGTAAVVVVVGYLLVRPEPGALPVDGPPGLGEVVDRAGEVADAFLPVPHGLPVIWDRELLDRLPLDGILGLGVLVTVAAALGASLRGDRVARRAWWLGLALCTAAVIATGTTGLRHLGAAYLVALAALWLHGRDGGSQALASPLPRSPAPDIVTALAVVGVVTGTVVGVADLRRPFSTASAMAAALEGQLGPETALVGDTDFGTSGVAVLLDRPMLYPADGRWGTFVVWDRDRTCDLQDVHPGCVPPDVLLAAADRASAAGARAVVVVTTYPVDHPRLRLSLEISGGMAQGEEQHHAYRLLPD